MTDYYDRVEDALKFLEESLSFKGTEEKVIMSSLYQKYGLGDRWFQKTIQRLIQTGTIERYVKGDKTLLKLKEERDLEEK